MSDGIKEFVVPLRKESKDSLTRLGMQNMRGIHHGDHHFYDRKGLAEMEEKERVLLSERAHEHLDSLSTVKENMH